MNLLQLEIDNIATSYGLRVVFKDISLTLQQGEILVVNGANGSGKSTLLRLLCGLQQPDHGSIHYTFQGQHALPREATHLIGWVSPDLALYRELTGQENLRFFAAMRGISNSQIDRLLNRVGLAGRGHERVACYSSGMVQRLRYAYALLHNPPILLLDEPTVTLDELGATMVESVIEAQRQIGITVIATNDQRELRFADYLLTLGTM